MQKLTDQYIEFTGFNDDMTLTIPVNSLICIKTWDSNRVTIARADASDILTQAYGITLTPIAPNTSGKCIKIGRVIINKVLYNEGTVLYLSDTPGLFTNVAPANSQVIGYVISNHNSSPTSIFLEVGPFITAPITPYTDENAQDAVGGILDSSLVYNDVTPLISRAALTGDITASQGSNTTTLATVNSNVGSFGSASSIPVFSVNAKGLITSVVNTGISINSTTITDFTEATQDAIGAMVNSTLTYNDATPSLSINLSNSNTWASQQTFSAAPILTGFTPGSVLFAGTFGVITQDNSSIFFDDTTNRLGISQIVPTSKIDITTNSLGVTQTTTSGLALVNTTVAAAGAQQISPGIRWSGQGWKTTATAASQEVSFIADVLPVQGTTAPTGTWQLKGSINGGAYTTLFSTTTGGSTTLSNGLTFDSTSRIFSGSTINVQSNSTTLQYLVQNQIGTALVGTVFRISYGSALPLGTTACTLLNLAGRLGGASGSTDMTGMSLTHSAENSSTYSGTIRGLYHAPTLSGTGFTLYALDSTQGSLRLADTFTCGSGSLAASLIGLTQTWNTSGTPTAIKLNITDTASNAASLLMDLQVGGTSQFKVDKTGKVISNNIVRLKGYTVATLPAGTVGDTAYVTDALLPMYLMTAVGGGAVTCKVFYNGTNWIT